MPKINPRLPGGALNPRYLVYLWRRLLKESLTPSMATIADLLAEEGILSPRTGRPYTRQNVHLTLRMIPEGRELLDAKVNG